MRVNWEANGEVAVELPRLAGFAVAILPQSMMAVLLRCLPDEVPSDESFLIGMSADVARRLAASLLQAAEAMSEPAGAAQLN